MEKIRIDIVPGGVTPVAHASQNDVGRSIRFNLFSGDSEYTLTGSEAINISMRRPDGTLRTQGLTNTMSNYVVFTTVDGDLTVGGIYSCELTIYKGDAILGSRNFVLKVEPDAYDGVNVVVMDCGPTDICTFETNLADNLVSLKAAIVASGGNGTPSTPIPIVGHSELNLVRCGANLWDGDAHDGKGMGGTGTEYTDAASFATLFVPLPVNATIYLNPTNWRNWINWYKADQTFLSQSVVDANNEATVPVGAAYARFTGILAEKATAMVCFASQKTEPYFPYNGDTFTVQFGQTVYGGVYDANAGKVRITHVDEIFDGSNDENWVFGGWGSGIRLLCDVSETMGDNYIVCDKLKSLVGSEQEVYGIKGRYAESRIDTYWPTGIGIIDGDLASVRTYLSNNPIEIVYELATPIEIDVSELSVETIVGVNNVFCDTGETELKYLKIEG